MRIAEQIFLGLVFLFGASWIAICFAERPESFGLVAASVLYGSSMICWFLRSRLPV